MTKPHTTDPHILKTPRLSAGSSLVVIRAFFDSSHLNGRWDALVTPARFELTLPAWEAGLLDRLEEGAINKWNIAPAQKRVELFC